MGANIKSEELVLVEDCERKVKAMQIDQIFSVYNFVKGFKVQELPKQTNYCIRVEGKENAETLVKLMKNNGFGLKVTMLQTNNDEQIPVEENSIFNPLKPSNGLCNACKSDTDLICGGCYKLHYCSQSCQRKDWYNHRPHCVPRFYKHEDLPEVEEVHQKVEPKEERKDPYPHYQAFKEDSKFNSTATTSRQKYKMSEIKENKHTPLHSITVTSLTLSEMPQNNTCVVITSFSASNLVFVRAKNPDADRAFYEIAPKLSIIGPNLKPLQQPFKLGSMAIAFNEGYYQRAQILKLEPYITVILLESGTRCIVKENELYFAPPEIANLRRLPVPVNLKGVPKNGMTDYLHKFMSDHVDLVHFMIKYDPVKDIDTSTNAYAVELVEMESNKNFNKEIIEILSGISEVGSVEEDPVFDYEFLPYGRLPCGENKDLVVVDHSSINLGIVKCSTVEYLADIKTFEQKIQTHVRSIDDRPFRPQVNELCLSKCAANGKWYRGCCRSWNNNNANYATIYFIDHGFENEVHINDIRRFSKELIYKKYVMNCKIIGIPKKCSPKLVTLLKRLLPCDKILRCAEVLFIEDGSYRLMLPDILKCIDEQED